MLILHVEAPDVRTLLQLAAKELNVKIEYKDTPAEAPEPKDDAEDGPPAVNTASTCVVGAGPSVPALPPMPGKTRDRPRKPRPQFDTRLPGATAQPAVAQNTGSAPAVQAPAAEGANTEAAGSQVVVSPATPAPAAPTLTAEAMRKSFGRILDKLPGEPGFAAATKILAELGYQKITEVKPEHYDAVVAATDKLLAA